MYIKLLKPFNKFAIRVSSSPKEERLRRVFHTFASINHYLSNWIWFSVVYTLIFNGMCNQSGQNVDSRDATERPFREYMIRDKMKKKKKEFTI